MSAKSRLDHAGEHAKERHACLSDTVNHTGDTRGESIGMKFLKIGSVVLLLVANISSGTYVATHATWSTSHLSAAALGEHTAAFLTICTGDNVATFRDA